MYTVIRSWKHGAKVGMAISATWVCLSTTVLLATDKTRSTGSKDRQLSLVEKYGKAYVAPEKPSLVDVGEAQYLTLTGTGAPGGAEFVRKISALYGMAYTLKMKSAQAGRDYGIAPLEGLWWGSKDSYDFFEEPRETWNWKVLLLTPTFITDTQVREIAAEIAKQRNDAATAEVRLEKITEGRCVQVLHVGPYTAEVATVAAMTAFSKAEGLVQSGYHHEIYLSDPKNTDPKELRTILRLPVKPESD